MRYCGTTSHDAVSPNRLTFSIEHKVRRPGYRRGSSVSSLVRLAATIHVVAICCLALRFPASAREAFNEFEALKSPQIGRQACALARWAVECRLAGVQPVKPPIKLHRIFMQRSGVFVTVTKGEQPRGCMGTVEPMQTTVAGEIIQGAIGAATADLRRKPLMHHELKQVRFHVSIVGRLRPVRSQADLNPKLLGLLVRSGTRSGILLPGEARTASWQIRECRRKAGVRPGEQIRMYVFRTVVFDETGTARGTR